MNTMRLQNSRKKKSSFFSRLTKRQKTTKQTLMLMDPLATDQMPLKKEELTMSRKQSIPVMTAIDSMPPSLQSLSSSQSSMDSQSNHDKLDHETEDSSSSPKRTKSLYAPCAHNFANLDDEFMELRVDRWREKANTFAELEFSAQFSMTVEVDEQRRLACDKAAIQSYTEQQEEPKRTGTATNLHGPLDTTSDSMPLPVLSSKQKGMVEPTLFELDSSLLSELSAINLVEESFSDEDSQESLDGTQSDSDVETSDLRLRLSFPLTICKSASLVSAVYSIHRVRLTTEKDRTRFWLSSVVFLFCTTTRAVLPEMSQINSMDLIQSLVRIMFHWNRLNDCSNLDKTEILLQSSGALQLA